MWGHSGRTFEARCGATAGRHEDRIDYKQLPKVWRRALSEAFIFLQSLLLTWSYESICNLASALSQYFSAFVA
jgi:hypothetical protein